ncbi:MAG TPA: TIGR03364 family FAD-dependent oxidoreductase [Flavisolibacter sp.]|nr:TIGR03364 family FAD-dependent oxidoreductase [Flavisolibacter sp.]
MSKSAIVIGAGIAGLATARALAIRGYKVTVLERTEKAVGASIRNFGMIWPIGQPSGALYHRALLSKSIWKGVCTSAAIWFEEAGSLHATYDPLEQKVLEEFYETAKAERPLRLLNANESVSKSAAIKQQGLHLSLYSSDEMIVDPREAIRKIPGFLHEKYGVEFHWSSGVTALHHPTVCCGNKVYEADRIFICNGADFETLFPEQFAQLPLTKCKLQMMRTEAQPANWRLGSALCGGLSLIHYKSFAAAPSLSALAQKFQMELPEYLQWGIHVMTAQNESGEITIGDSHEYGQTFEPFDKALINDLILSYLQKFCSLKSSRIIETWNGIYPKLKNGGTEIVLQPQNGVTIINGLGGAGMSLSFGLAEEVIGKSG